MEPALPELARLLEQRDWLRALARALVGAEEAEDLAQETWLAALRHPGDRAEPRAWLAGIARNLAHGLRRSRGRRVEREQRAARAETLPSTDELVERLDTEQRLARELAGLREPFRTTLLLRFHEGLGAEEIARRQGVPAGTVRWRTKAGLAELRERLERALGGREAFGLALLPLVRGPGVPGASVVASVGGGGLVMGMLGKGLALAAAVGLVALVAARLGPREANGGDVEAARAAPSLGEPSEPADAREPRVDAAVPLSASPDGRVALPTGEKARARLRILESDGTPHAGRRVVVRPLGGGLAREARTDAEGRLSLEADGTRVELAIERVGAFAERRELALEPGERELRLAEGLELSGRVVVQDGASPGGIALTLVPAGADWWSYDPVDPFSTPRVLQRTGADGSFAFRALAAGSYDLAFPLGYRGIGAGESDPEVRLARRDLRPARGLVLEVERLPHLTGRLVEADGRTPTAGVVECRFTWAIGTNMDTGARAAEDGRFELVPGEPWREIELEFWGLPGERGRTQAAFRESELGAGWDLGDLRLVPGRSLTLRVRDPAGKPVEGARTDLDAPPTDVRGETRLADVTAEAVRVVARGFQEQRARLAASVETVEVTLEPAPELFLDLHDRRGAPVGGLLVELRAESWLFDGKSPSLLLSATREGRLVMWDEEPFAARYTTDDAGRLRCDSLAPGVPFELRVLAHGGAVVHERAQAALGPDERRVLPVVLARETLELRVRVLDEHGTPVRGARLSLPAIRSGSVAHGNEHGTDAEGRFRCALLDLPFRLTLRHPGYLPLEREFERAPTEELELALERGLDVAVRVVDEAGSPQAGGRLSVAGLEAASSAPGRFEARGLAAGEHEFVLRLGGREFVRMHAAHEPELEFRVPVMGALEARWELPASVAGARFVELELHDRTDGRLALQQGFFDTPAGTHRFEPLMPGEYEVLLKCEDGEAERVLAGAWVSVLAGQTASARLEPVEPAR
jgi:RNA polymerase sigma factor (sigma-70 family)